MHDAMPPPPSPGKYGAVGVGGGGRKTEEVERVNAALLDKIQALEKQLEVSLGGMTLEEREKAKKETDQRMRELTIASEFASREASTSKIELEEIRLNKEEMEKQNNESIARLDEASAKLATAESNLARMEREMKIQKQRAEDELEKAMAFKRAEITDLEEKVKAGLLAVEHEKKHAKVLSLDAQVSNLLYPLQRDVTLNNSASHVTGHEWNLREEVR